MGDFTMPDRREVGNALHWVMDPLGDKVAGVLRAMEAGCHPWMADRFSEAYLISRECIEADLDERTYTLTDKGHDALEFVKVTDGLG